MSLSDFQMYYQFSPITLVGGIAQNMNGGTLPILYLLQPSAFPDGATGDASSDIDPSTVFAHFSPMPGGSLIENEPAEFPLANQIVAANAQIVQPLTFSMLMTCPASGDGGYDNKIGIITALQTALAQHTLTGGTYNVSTPSFIYTNCLLINLVDASTEDTAQVQNAWSWNFRVPLLTIAQAQQAQNNLLSKLSSGTQVQGTDGAVAWTGPDNTVGQPNSLATPSYVTSAGGSSNSVSGLTGIPA